MREHRLDLSSRKTASPTFYHAGDTGVTYDMALISELYHPAIALLPIGGVYTMKPAEAALAARSLCRSNDCADALRNVPGAIGKSHRSRERIKTPWDCVRKWRRSHQDKKSRLRIYSLQNNDHVKGERRSLFGGIVAMGQRLGMTSFGPAGKGVLRKFSARP